jgi:hypothetical protein
MSNVIGPLQVALHATRVALWQRTLRAAAHMASISPIAVGSACCAVAVCCGKQIACVGGDEKLWDCSLWSCLLCYWTGVFQIA